MSKKQRDGITKTFVATHLISIGNYHPVFLFPSFSLPDVLCDPTDLIWRKWSPFEAMTGRKSLSSDSDKGDNEMILGLYTDLLAFASQTRKLSARKPSDEWAVRPVIASNGVPFLQMRSVGLHNTSGRKKEGRK